jgi:hypothetical protein
MVHGITVYISVSDQIEQLFTAELTFLRIHDWDQGSWTIILLNWSEV